MEEIIKTKYEQLEVGDVFLYHWINGGLEHEIIAVVTQTDVVSIVYDDMKNLTDDRNMSPNNTLKFNKPKDLKENIFVRHLFKNKTPHETLAEKYPEWCI